MAAPDRGFLRRLRANSRQQKYWRTLPSLTFMFLNQRQRKTALPGSSNDHSEQYLGFAPSFFFPPLKFFQSLTSTPASRTRSMTRRFSVGVISDNKFTVKILDA